MTWSTRVKDAANSQLRRFNLKVGTLAAERAESARLEALRRDGQFGRAIFPVPDCMLRSDPSELLRLVREYTPHFDGFTAADRNPVGYQFDNEYYGSPDAEVLYTLIRKLAPARVLEIGCGNSTRVTRMAIRDGGLSTRLHAIDPQPRAEIAALVDSFERMPLESDAGRAAVLRLAAGDVLFIDSSHELRTGGDVVALYLELLPQLPSGVVIHIHDVFLPFDYPEKWVLAGWSWNEQYLVQAMLQFGSAFEVLWAGRYLQSTRADFASYFPHCGARFAQSLWLRKR